uniref:Tryptophan-rich sensory protein n=1 Tax=candidate division WOR-3 bacterium TaxID=2052148 RepID=A0A7C6A8T2_UNCW3
MNSIAIFKLVISIIICQLAGIIGAIFTNKSIPTWYASLKKPAFNPPAWLFGPVWTALFLLMGIALFLIWQKGINFEGVKRALIVFSAQLIFNILWSILFFGLRSPLAAFIAIIILWILILLTIVLFYPIAKTAGLLLLPYLLWVSFASILNFSLWRLNG